MFEKEHTIRAACALFWTLLALGVGYLFFAYLFLPCLPFAAAWLFALPARRLAAWLAARTPLPERWTALGLSVLFLTGGTYLCLLALSHLWTLFVARLFDLFAARGTIAGDIALLFARLRETGLFFWLPTWTENEISILLRQGLDALFSRLSAIVPHGVRFFFGTLPHALVAVVMFALATFSFAATPPKRDFSLFCLLSRAIQARLRRFFVAARAYLRITLRVYGTLFFFTFAVLFFGLTLCGVRAALPLALVTAALDALPVLGVGVVLLPWAVGALLLGKTGRAAALLVLWLCLTFLREWLSARLLGRAAGVNCTLSLFLSYLGLSLFGIVGALLAPLLAGILAEKARSQTTR